MNTAAARSAKSKDPAYVRLRAALLEVEGRLAALKAKRGAADAVVQACETCLQNAKQQDSLYVAWDCIHQFNDAILDAMNPAELGAHWFSLTAEADEKLKGWRAEAAEALVKKFKGGTTPPLAVVRELQKHLAAAAQNQQYKIEVYARETLPSLIIFLALVVGATLAFCYYVMNAKAPSDELLRWAEDLSLGILAGGLGGILSMSFSLGRADLSKKIPDIRFSVLVTSMRPLLGSAVAIPVVVLVSAKYIVVKGFDYPLSILAFCFLAGFSERWFLGLIEKFESSAKKK